MSDEGVHIAVLIAFYEGLLDMRDRKPERRGGM
jgi:hypothetical protein